MATTKRKETTDGAVSQSEGKSNATFLSGRGDGKLQRLLVGDTSSSTKVVSRDLINRLQQFLPELARANEELPEPGTLLDSAVEIIIPDENSEHGCHSGEQDENCSTSENDNEEESSGAEADSNAISKPSVEMNISLFPLEDEDEEGAEDQAEIRSASRPSKRSAVVEIDEADEDDGCDDNVE